MLDMYLVSLFYFNSGKKYRYIDTDDIDIDM